MEMLNKKYKAIYAKAWVEKPKQGLNFEEK